MRKILIILGILITICLICLLLLQIPEIQTYLNERPFLSFLDAPAETTGLTEPAETIACISISEGSFAGSYYDSAFDKTIDYHMYIPANATEQMPLIVYLHGLGAVGANHKNESNPLIVKAREVYGDAFPFLILAPSSMANRSWLSYNLPQRLHALIEAITQEYNVDRNKIIITGHSMGATGVYRQIELFGNYYSAAVPISVPDTSIIDIESCTNVPIWCLAGSEEEPCGYFSNQLAEDIRKAGGFATFTLMEGVAHGKSAEAAFTLDVFQWAISQ